MLTSPPCLAISLTKLELRKEYSTAEIVGLCMAAAIAHCGHVLNEAVRLPAGEGFACPLPPRHST